MTTRLSPEESLQRLARTIEKTTPILPFQPRPRAWLFAGTIDDNRFSICRIPAGKRIYENQIDGLVEPTPTGTSITLTIQPHSSGILTSSAASIILICWSIVIVSALLYFILIGQLPLYCGLIPLIVGTIVVLFLRANPGTPATFDLDTLTALGHLRSIFAIETEVSLDENTVSL
jgi:hypothetical protein